MVQTVVWYERDKAILLEMIGSYSLNDYVQACHEARDRYLEPAKTPLSLVVDLRVMDDTEQVIPIEPFENLLNHSNLRKIFILARPSMAQCLMKFTQSYHLTLRIHLAEHLEQVDERLGLAYSSVS
ncbi:MAG: hypothetical protein AAFV93_14490 [Chloroflexota bacterium]